MKSRVRPAEKVHGPWVEHNDKQVLGGFEHLNITAAKIDDGDWIAGTPDISQADVTTTAAFTFANLARPHLELAERFPQLARFAERCETLPAFCKGSRSSAVPNWQSLLSGHSSPKAQPLGTEGEVVAPTDREVRFGPFCLRPAAHLLLEAGTPVHIGVRALDLLIVLIERAGEVVTKDELFARVWRGVTVDEGNLRTQVALVRKVLRDGQGGARYLMTVPGRGYRFVAPFRLRRHAKPVEPRAPIEFCIRFADPPNTIDRSLRCCWRHRRATK